MKLKQFFEAVNYRITEGSEFCWQCFGPNAYRLDSWNGDTDGYTVSITFDTVSQVIYQAEAYDYAANRAYRWQNPEFIEAHVAEATKREVDPDEALDGVKFIDLEVEEDFLEKAKAIAAGEEYDTRVQVELILEDDVMFAAMKLAHEQDVTFNELVEHILEQKIEELKNFGD